MQRYILFSKRAYKLFVCKKKIVLTLFFACFSTIIFAQSFNPTIKISDRNSSIERIFTTIESQTGFRIARETDFDVNRIVALGKGNYTLSELMDLALKNSGYTYLAGENGIFVRKAQTLGSESENRAATTAKSTLQSIFGTVESLDQGALLKGSLITLSGKVDITTTSDSLGFFTLSKIPAGTYSLTASLGGYKDQKVTISVRPNESTRVMFVLEPIIKEERRVWRASLAYPEYENQSKIKASDFTDNILPYQRQRLASFAIKTNLLHDGVLAPNLGVEFRIGRGMTLDIPVTYKPFNAKNDGIRQAKLLIAQPELRFWNDPFNGHFLGAHLIYAQYNLGGIKLPLGIFPELKNYRYVGQFYGAGVSYGYHAILSNRISLEFTLGLGYGYADYKRYTCRECSKYIDKGSKHYFGPTKAGISLIYMLK